MSETGGQAIPRWKTMVRVEAKIRPDQRARLQALATKFANDKLMAKLTTPGIATDRLTENTFIRAALDVLFLVETELSGFTENEIIESAKAAVNNLRETNNNQGETWDS